MSTTEICWVLLTSLQSAEQKFRYFQLLVRLGLKYIEVAMPCASDLEYNFVQQLIKMPGAVPDDVMIQAITPCRKDLIQKTVNSLRGAKRAVLFSYISVSDNYRETMLRLSEDECIERVYDCVSFARSITKDAVNNRTEWMFGLGCEDAGDARPGMLLRICEAIKAAWEPTKEQPLIFGMATSVEYYMPNIFADQVEHFLRKVPEREKILLSLHPHNDRGTAVAAAELSCLAGADMVEGCLFGNGERAGNVDLVTLALNCYRQGLDPGLNFSDLPKIRSVVEDITKIPVHKRAPYAGDFAFLALSGTHQDAIRKGFAKRDSNDTDLPGIERTYSNGNGTGNGYMNGINNSQGSTDTQEKTWQVPYLPMDPGDLGITSASVIGINSQSGKAGISWILKNTIGLSPPDFLARDFSNLVKIKSTELNGELSADELCAFFLKTYQDKRIAQDTVLVMQNSQTNEERSVDMLLMEGLIVKDFQERLIVKASNNDSALLLAIAEDRLSQALGSKITCVEHEAHSLKDPSEAVAYVRSTVDDNDRAGNGVGIGAEMPGAYISAILSSVLVS